MKWENCNIYPCRKMGSYPQIYIRRAMHNRYKGIEMQFFEFCGKEGTTISMTNRMAKLIIKKIQQALEGK